VQVAESHSRLRKWSAQVDDHDTDACLPWVVLTTIVASLAGAALFLMVLSAIVMVARRISVKQQLDCLEAPVSFSQK